MELQIHLDIHRRVYNEHRSTSAYNTKIDLAYDTIRKYDDGCIRRTRSIAYTAQIMKSADGTRICVYIPHFKLKYLVMNIAACDADRRLEADAG